MVSAKAARLVVVTASNEEQAASIARVLVAERLCACVNIVGPIRSVYRWQEAIEDGPEHLMLIKTRASLLTKLERRVRELHSYEVPEVIALGLEAVSEPYLKWMMESSGPKPRRGR